MHQLLLGHGDIEKGIGLAGHFRHTPTDEQHEIGVLYALEQLGI